MRFENKTVLLIIHQGILGGAERQGLSLSRVLTENYNCRVYLLLTYSSKMTEEFREFAKKCKVIEILHAGDPYLLVKKEFSIKNFKRLGWSIKYLKNLTKKVAPIEPDLIIPFLNFPSKVAYYLYKFMPTVKFTFWHQLGLDSWSHDILEWIAAKRTPLVIANAPNGLELFLEAYNRPKAELYVLPQFVSLKYKKIDSVNLKAKLKLPKDAVIIGMIAHYRPEKLHFLLLKAFQKISKEFPESILIFLGNRNSKTVQSLKNAVQNYGLDQKVYVLSDYPVVNLLNLIDIGVLVSEIEGTPNAVMEYMLYGLPVICTNHPGCKKLIGNSPYLIQNNQMELSKCLKELLSSKTLRLVEGKKNKARIREFNEISYIKKLEAIISN